jgi:hypothetical protein
MDAGSRKDSPNRHGKSEHGDLRDSPLTSDAAHEALHQHAVEAVFLHPAKMRGLVQYATDLDGDSFALRLSAAPPQRSVSHVTEALWETGAASSHHNAGSWRQKTTSDAHATGGPPEPGAETKLSYLNLGDVRSKAQLGQ